MKWYQIYVGTDYADHSTGKYYTTYSEHDFDQTWLVNDTKNLLLKFAWVVMISIELDPETKAVKQETLLSLSNPLKKKLVLDPRKNKATVANKLVKLNVPGGAILPNQWIVSPQFDAEDLFAPQSIDVPAPTQDSF